ncbi:MAG: TerC family protein [Ignavibacteriales bacterium]|nr:TerC family protein [Ignavibacteriales bacterium]
MLALDLGVFQKKAHFPSMKEALGWTAFWISLAILFGLFIWYERGSVKELEFFTGYVVEEALSVDNVFVFIVIFSYFSVPKNAQHKVLFWGILGAIIFRAIFIVAGAALISQFHWIIYLLGAFLIFTAIKLAVQRETEVHPEHNPLIKLARKIFPVTKDYSGEKFFVKQNGRRYATPLLLVLLMIESTDIAFATDSIPAIFAITQDTFIIYTSNIFAILGLRSLYFVASGFMKEFRYLKYGLSVVLGFIGVKMLIEPWFQIPILSSLAAIFIIIATSILTSVLHPGKKN